MSDSVRLLELIEKGIVECGGDFGGWTCRIDDTLQLFDGRVTLRAELKDAGPLAAAGTVHAHVLTTLHEYDDEVLDACLMGMGQDREAALGQAGLIWITGVAGPIKSFLDNKPICMTCQAGVEGGDAAQGYSLGNYGLPGLRAYVGPSFSRGLGDEQPRPPFGDTMPWFRFAGESAAPRRVHLAKAIVCSKGEGDWNRTLEIDGHDVSFNDPDWPACAPSPGPAWLIRFAVFEFPRGSTELLRRAELERTIRFFAENYAKYESVDALMQEMVSRGFALDLVDETESLATIAFGRTLFDHHGVQYPTTVIRARRDGRVETDVPLMSIPAYTRARALAVRLRETMPKDDFQALGLHSAESHVILQAMKAAGDDLDLTQVKLMPSVVPERDVSEQTMDAALAALNDLVQRSRPRQAKPRSDSFDVLDQMPAARARSRRPILPNTTIGWWALGLAGIAIAVWILLLASTTVLRERGLASDTWPMLATGTVLIGVAAVLNLRCLWHWRGCSLLNIVAVALVIWVALFATSIVVGRYLLGLY